MNNNPDEALERFKKIEADFSVFVKSRGQASETDTRVKLIDRILKEVCMWPESALSREDHVDTGFTDYQLKLREIPYVVVEAKREGESFTFPEHGKFWGLSPKFLIVIEKAGIIFLDRSN